MKNATILLVFLSTVSYAQVGIGTSSPAASLDINGDVIIRNIPIETDKTLAKDFLLLTNNGAVKSVALEDVYKETFKTMIKGNFSNAAPIDISLVSGPAIIPFNNEEFDVNDEFDPTTHTFTAKQDGIYEVMVHIKGQSLNIATNYGVRILKNSTVEHRNSFANVGVLSVNVTPPTRSIQSYIQLDETETITFELESSLAAVTTLENSKTSCYFTIRRIW